MALLSSDEAIRNLKEYDNFYRNEFNFTERPYLLRDYYTKVIMSAGAGVFGFCLLSFGYGSGKSDKKSLAPFVVSFFGATIMCIMYITAVAVHHDVKRRLRDKYYKLRMDEVLAYVDTLDEKTKKEKIGFYDPVIVKNLNI